MVRRRGKRKTASSSKTLVNEDAEIALAVVQTSDSLPVNVEEEKTDAQSEDKVEIAGEEESEKITDVDSDAIDEIVAEINGDNKAEPEQSTSENDELDDQEDVMWDDDEDNYEEDVAFDADEVTEEGATDEENDDVDEVGEEEATDDEEDGDMDDVSEEEEANKKNTQEEKEIAKGNGKEAEAKKDGKEAKEHNNTKKSEVSLRNVKKSSERIGKNKLQAERSEKVEAKDKPEPSRKTKVKKRMKSMGMIFICSSKTKNDCYQYRVLGLPESKKDIVENIYTGMRLFLYDVDLKLMYGIYKAAGPGGYNIEPKAFKSQFPSQVRFTVLDDCLPLPEEKFKKVMKENYYTKTKFDCQLNSEQVKKLCKLFVTSTKGNRTKKLGKTLKAEKPPPTLRRERIPRPRTGGDGPRIAPREEIRYIERPRKRPRRAIISPLHHPPSSYLYDKRTADVDTSYRQDPYLDRPRDRRDPYRDSVRDSPPPRDHHYRDRRDPYVERRHYSYREGAGVDPYLDGRSPYAVEARDSYRDARDPVYPKRTDSYRDVRDPYAVEPRDSNRDARDPVYPKRLDSYRNGRGPYAVEPRDSYRDARDHPIYPKRHDSYRDLGRDSYLERNSDLERGGLYSSEPYSSYRREPIPFYREEPVVEYRDSYRREEVYAPLSTIRHRSDIGSLKRERHEPIYSADYPSSSSRAREYRL
ncbi:hypothetical protein ABFS82_04G181700 [Erythranthe guttata]|uniref:uncharacterized protein LOC105949076 n=1 Tax=Erythranthe guttata TaxID=4155 RepID=UPI00064E0BFF|nr:PREDICTED: uncharacterized protein LOC105949076 [Erythranthe guttata]|eukprot:XP_012827798.1 PREDICTED: uncharacterized protein LOC105949076 [Erythranthe guttata]